VGYTVCFAAVFVSSVSRCGLVTLSSGGVANVSWGKALGPAFSKWNSFTRGTARYALECNWVANVTIASLVLVVLRTDPFLETWRRVVWVRGFTSAKWT